MIIIMSIRTSIIIQTGLRRDSSAVKRENVRTLKLHAYPVGDGLDTLRPQRLVELGVKADVRGAHRLLRKVDDGLDGPGSTLLEGAAVNTLVEMDGVFARHDILEGRARLAGLVSRRCTAESRGRGCEQGGGRGFPDEQRFI